MYECGDDPYRHLFTEAQPLWISHFVVYDKVGGNFLFQISVTRGIYKLDLILEVSQKYNLCFFVLVMDTNCSL